ncbi:MAG: NAD(P)H-binding protein [Rhodobacteraceae bacterium]|nr:NAD(P)H-binding protein [Paracoccaceae bacterium]
MAIARRSLIKRSAGALTLAGSGRLAHAAENLRPVVVIGATGRSAGPIIAQALEQGRRVTGLARRPERLTIDHPNFTAARGDVYDIDSLSDAMRGDEVVISVIGRGLADVDSEPGYVDLYSVGGSATLQAMRRKGNKRIITMTSGGTEQIPPAKPTNGDPSDEFVWRHRNVYGDMQRWERILLRSDMEYVVLRPRRLIDGPIQNNLKLSVHRNHAAFDERSGGHRSSVTFADVAAFTLAQCEGNGYLGTAVGIYSDVYLGALPEASKD